MENRKPFNLEAALRGEPVVTRDGEKVTEIVLLKTLQKGKQPLVCVINGVVELHDIDGTFLHERPGSDYDLFMAPVKKTGWVNVYKGMKVGPNIHETEEDADKYKGPDFITRLQLPEWTE